MVELEQRARIAVTAALDQHRPQLELLVRRLVDDELARIAAELVEAELAHRLNGATVTASTVAAVPASRMCSVCGERPVERYRTKCSRRRRALPRESETVGELPRHSEPP